LNTAEPVRSFTVFTLYCLRSIAVAAPDIASHEPDEDMPLPDPRAFTLDGRKNLFYAGIFHTRNNTEQ
jgi:hypothetical protein